MALPRYCVIGAGPAGLATLHALRDAGLDADCFEATDRIGGHWNTDYRCLHLITPRDTSGYTGHPFPSTDPLFPSRDQMLAYVHAYAEQHDLPAHVTFSTAVEELEPEGDGWLVRTADGERRRYAGVLVANGHLWDPFQPELGGYTGRQLHSGAYGDPGDIDGERVLVVGSGNSGCDIAVDCAQTLRLRTTVSIRRGHLFQPKTFAGRPRGELPIMRLPPRLQDRALRLMIRLAVGDPQRYGLPAPATWSLLDQAPVVNTQLLHWIQHGRIAVAPDIRAAEGLEVEFADGTRGTFDTIVWCTGFRVTFPFLDHRLLRWRDDVPLRGAGCILPHGGPGRLYLIGLVAPRGPQLPVYSQQAALAVRMLRLQERLADPLALRLATVHRPEWRIDVVRSEWQDQMTRTERAIATLEAGSAT